MTPVRRALAQRRWRLPHAKPPIESQSYSVHRLGPAALAAVRIVQLLRRRIEATLQRDVVAWDRLEPG